MKVSTLRRNVTKRISNSYVEGLAYGNFMVVVCVTSRGKREVAIGKEKVDKNRKCNQLAVTSLTV